MILKLTKKGVFFHHPEIGTFQKTFEDGDLEFFQNLTSLCVDIDSTNTESMQAFFETLTEAFVPKSKEEKENLQTFKEVLNDPDIFESDGRLFLKGISIPIPLEIAKMIQNGEDSKKYKNFWFWVAQNPDAESRENIYAWVKKQELPILPSGLILSFRRVVKCGDVDYGLINYVTEQYHLLRGRKKSTNIPVYKNEEGYNLKEGAPIGNLKILFHTPQDVYYTDNYTKLERYYIGVENRMSRDGVDLDKRNTCSTGYHSGGAGFAYKGFGDTPVAVVLNPKDVIVVYENSYGKCRSSAFTVVGVLKEDAQWANDKDILEEIENVSRNTFTDFHQLLEMFENGELTIDNTKWSKEEIDFARSVIDPKEILSNLDVSNYNLGEYK